MAIGTGAGTRLAYINEGASFGVTPGSPQTILLRNAGNTLEMTRGALQSAELRSDRMIADFRLGTKALTGNINCEMLYADLDDLLEALLGGTWGAGNITGVHADVTALNTDKSFTSAGLFNFVTLGLRPGDKLTWTGWTSPALGNNAEFTIATVATNKITVVEPVLAKASGDTVTLTTLQESVKVGSTKRSFSIEVGYLDIAQYLVYTGVVLNRAAFSIRPNAISTVQFTVVGKRRTLSGTTLNATPTVPTTNSPMDSASGVIKIGGATVAIASALDFTLDNAAGVALPIAADSAADYWMGRSNLTGTLSAYFQDATLLQLFDQETPSSVEVTLTGLPVGKTLTFKMPQVKFQRGAAPITQEGGLQIAMPFQAIYDPTATTSFQIFRRHGV